MKQNSGLSIILNGNLWIAMRINCAVLYCIALQYERERIYVARKVSWLIFTYKVRQFFFRIARWLSVIVWPNTWQPRDVRKTHKYVTQATCRPCLHGVLRRFCCNFPELRTCRLHPLIHVAALRSQNVTSEGQICNFIHYLTRNEIRKQRYERDQCIQ